MSNSPNITLAPEFTRRSILSGLAAASTVGAVATVQASEAATTPTPMERMISSTREYMAALEEHLATKGMRPVWYSLADDFDFGFVCRIEAADA